MVIPLAECIARPGEGPRGLVIHLEAVAEGCGDKNGPPEEKLAFLAGLAHDAAKTAADWQEYIRGRLKKGPPHAPLGAALFAFWADDFIPRWEPDRRKQEPLHDLGLDWIRMIYRHHGALDDLHDRPPWVDAAAAVDHEPPTLLATCDRDGLDSLVRRHFPEYGRRLGEFDGWFRGFDRQWDRRQRVIRTDLLKRLGPEDRDRLGVRLANLGARLIYADRRHAADWEPDHFAAEDTEAAIQQHAKHCREEADKARADGADEALLRARADRQGEALRSYRQHADQRVFTLLLPTGYGKTLTGLRIGLEAVRSGRCKRLLYVAPYISILSQAAKVIEDATGLPVFLHHHLTALGLEDHQPYDLLDTWQAPIVATTFNQLFRALFPSRAQECLRIPALDGAFVFIDEPQIVDVTVWCAFLRALAIVSRQRQCQILFCTATLPPLGDGLGASAAVFPLVGEVTPAICRYVIRSEPEPWRINQVADEACKRFKQHGSVAVILNTVRDAVETFNQAREKNTPDWFFLAAMMLAGHKALRIQEIRKRLKRDPPSKAAPTGVVCTQVLEAGVDLSFRSLLRALPIFSSIAQAAGRANRHGEGDLAEVVVFPFVREDGTESRRYVYRDQGANSKTDQILAQNPTLSEDRLPAVLSLYYDRCWEQNPHLTSLQWFDAAARGRWTELAGQEPFGGDYPKVDVFVPGAERYLADAYWPRLTAFGAGTANELLARSRDRCFRRGLSFRERKQLSALLGQFTVPVPRKVATAFAQPYAPEDWLWLLNNPGDYSDATGLAHLLGADADDPASMIL
jgi:CRISPR-associated endonuclease Cas3-HD